MDQLLYAKSLDSLTGELARQLDRRLRVHLKRESETVTPLIASFVGLAEGKVPRNAGELKRRYAAAEKAYAKLFAEHKELLSLVNRLQAAAREDKEEEIVRFCEDFIVHAHLEEQVLYPAAVIAGRYLKLLTKGNGKK